jgi:hypothetical protein
MPPNYPAGRAIVAGSQIEPSRNRGQVEATTQIVGNARNPKVKSTAAPPLRSGLPPER